MADTNAGWEGDTEELQTLKGLLPLSGMRNLRRLPQRDESAVILLAGHRGNGAPGPGLTFTGKKMRVPISGKAQFCQKCATNQSP